ncbi:Na+/H+ antiporter [Chryseolinea sp. H1M3-3]|uniref:Na+/H+ antiporter n=1 Tax=Chryseolinea sp. H1M3-3 TaxID=3034144 RepID=UPI0023ED31A9|nr:Na+/H+ antiporter [Chryseolinea sp. H1M3-3]
MQVIFIEYVYLIFIIIALVMLANKLKIAYPIVLVLGGLALSFTKFFSNITIDPELIFFIFLPPLLYDAAWQTSWKEFWKWRRVITSFAFPIVIITSCVVAFASTALIPGFTLALGFLLGGIVSPPDAISATTIMRQVKAPKILVSVAEGESLLNDASALIVFRFALAAVVTGQFYFTEAVGDFFLVIIMGTLIGLAIGLIFYGIYRWLPTTPSIEIILSFLAPYCMYYFAERFHFSGVLAVVAGGLLLSNKRDKMLSYQGRVQGSNVWSTVGFMLNGVVFMLIGLELPYITNQVEEVSLGQAIWYGVVISLVLIVTRLCSAFGAGLFTRFIGRFITVADRNPGWKIPFVFGWSGMRGVVSLAAALSIPVLIQPGHPFPYRNLILVITFVVILVTLVLQGLTLPWIIKKINIEDKSAIREQEHELSIRKTIAETSLRFLEQAHGKEQELNDHLRNLSSKLRTDLTVFQKDVDDFNSVSRSVLVEYQDIYLAILNEQRKALHELNHQQEYDEELVRKYLSLVDLEETKLREVSYSR